MRERDRALAVEAPHLHDRVQRRQRDRQVRRMSGDARLGPAEDCVVAIEPLQCRAAGARPALIANSNVGAPEVCATRALHDVACHRRHVSELARSGEQQGLSEDGKAPAHLFVSRHVAHPRKSADPEAAIGQRLDFCHPREAVDIEEALRKRSAILHQSDQVGAARDEGDLGVARVRRDRFGGVDDSVESERVHAQLLRTAAPIASTMFG
jgi:hypothetical protein